MFTYSLSLSAYTKTSVQTLFNRFIAFKDSYFLPRNVGSVPGRATSLNRLAVGPNPPGRLAARSEVTVICSPKWRHSWDSKGFTLVSIGFYMALHHFTLISNGFYVVLH